MKQNKFTYRRAKNTKLGIKLFRILKLKTVGTNTEVVLQWNYKHNFKAWFSQKAFC